MGSKGSDLMVWMNGEVVPEHEARISIFDDGFTRGDAVFDAARTFAGKPFQVEEHIERFFHSCEMTKLTPALDQKRLVEVCHEMARQNAAAAEKYGDFWIIARVTRGGKNVSIQCEATTIIACDPIPFASRAPLYRDGIAIRTPSVRRTPPWALSPRIKSHNYLNFIVGEHEVKSADPKAWSVLLDENGNIAEGNGSNVFLVKGNTLYTPRELFVLPGITRATVMRLAHRLGYEVKEQDVDLRDAYLADEIFLTSTSLCLCGVNSVNGRPVKAGAFGPVTMRLLSAYNELVGIDVRAQYLKFL